MPQFLIDPKNEDLMALLRALAEFQPGVNDLRSVIVFFTASAETAALVSTFDDVTPVTDFRAVAGIPANVSTETPAAKQRKPTGECSQCHKTAVLTKTGICKPCAMLNAKGRNNNPAPAAAAAEEPDLADPALAAALDELADAAGLSGDPDPDPASLITGKRTKGWKLDKHPAQIRLDSTTEQRIDEIVRQDQARQQGQPVPSPKPIQAKGRFGVARKAA